MTAVFALIEVSEQVLFVQRTSHSSRPDQWCLPGGGVKADETIEDACTREVFEETGLRVSIAHTIARIDQTIYINCQVEGGTELLGIPNREIQAGVWCDTDKILELGEIMDLTRVVPLLQLAGFKVPEVPDDLKLSTLSTEV